MIDIGMLMILKILKIIDEKSMHVGEARNKGKKIAMKILKTIK